MLTRCVLLQRAKEMVLELLAEKDMQGPGGGMGTFNNFDGMGHGGGGPGGMEVKHCSLSVCRCAAVGFRPQLL